MKIHWYCPGDINSGIPWSDETLEGHGLGGAESQVVLLSRELARQGHDVTVYVTLPLYEGKNGHGVTWKRTSDYNPFDKRDVLILHRSWMGTKDLFKTSVAPCKVYFSCDQYTSGGKESRDKEIYPYLDCMFFISPFHKVYTKLYAWSHYLTEDKTYVTDLCVDHRDYLGEVQKEPNSLLFCSVPLRGLHYMYPIMYKLWALGLKPNLTITSDYRLWGSPFAGNDDLKEKFKGMPGVKFLGKVSRRELVAEQRKAQIMSYPTEYQECFCIAAAECMAAGAVPVTTRMAALETTVKDQETGLLLGGVPQLPEYQDEFARQINHLLVLDPGKLNKLRENGRKYALENYSDTVIASKWVDKFKEIIERKGKC